MHFSRVKSLFLKKIITCYSWKSFHKDEQADGSIAADNAELDLDSYFFCILIFSSRQ